MLNRYIGNTNMDAVLFLTQSGEDMSDAFMIPEYLSGTWYVVETRDGTVYLPDHVVSRSSTLENDLHAFVSGPIYSVEESYGVGVRLSAPGYLDCTEWTVFDTEAEARSYIRNTFDVCPDTGQPLEY